MKKKDYFENGDRPTIHDLRDMNKHSLDTYSLDFDNQLEDEADEIIRRLLKENRDSISNAEEMEHTRKTNKAKWEELQDRASQVDIDLDMQIIDHYYHNHLREGVLFAFAEVKLIYAFKQLEISINQLLKAAYPGEIKKNLNRFEDLHAFCQTKGIVTGDIEGYPEIMQLQKLSNTLKHSGALQDRLSGIPEFKGKEEIHFQDLEAFYRRIRTFPKLFLSKLSGAIFKDLYEFSDERLASLAETYVLRMDKVTAVKFSEQLLRHYA